VKPMTPSDLEAQLRDIGARRYHRLHPFHVLLHGGQCTKGQVQAWALNRYYYQAMIPLKDASLIARCNESALRREWRRRLVDHDGESEGDGGIARWLKLTDGPGLDRDYVVSLAGLLPATRFAVEAYVHFVRDKTLLEAIASSLTELFSPQIISERLAGMLKSYDFVSADILAYFSARAPLAQRDSEFALETSSAMPRPPMIKRPCSKRSNSSATCYGRCWMRSIMPMWRLSIFRPALSYRRTEVHERSHAGRLGAAGA
jgi:coenzyme PQQ biosynthesis protein C